MNDQYQGLEFYFSPSFQILLKKAGLIIYEVKKKKNSLIVNIKIQNSLLPTHQIMKETR